MRAFVTPFLRRVPRKVSGWSIIALSLLTISDRARAADERDFHISGIAVSERGGAPISGCHISAQQSGQAAVRRSPQFRNQGEGTGGSTATTDAQGRFALDLPSAGSWQLYGFCRGFRRQAYDRHEGFFSAVVLTAAAPTYDLRFVMEPDSIISGFVLDEAGEAVRNARLTLFAAEPTSPDLAVEAGGPVRSTTVTDDRGYYEFAELAPGDYVVEVQAEPWYAAGSQGRRFAENGGGAPANPALDVIYPLSFYPGVPDKRSAEILSVHDGESRQADFHLNPSPATHLRISPPSATGSDSPQRGQYFPQIERVTTDGNPFVNTSVQVDSGGQIDVGGLSPGLYRVTLRGPTGQQAPSFIRVPGGSTRVVDLSAATPVCELTLRFESDATDTPRMQVVLRDVESGATFTSYGQGNLQRRQVSPSGDLKSAERNLEVPPGRYRITLNNTDDYYLAGISSKGSSVSERTITVSSGSTILTLKLAKGRASVQGVAATGGLPLRGAMVMLVPSTFGQPGSIDILRRDQTNTDGSFQMTNVLPGGYILLAIDGGWTVNWRDPSTLAAYLVHGVPLTLSAGATVRQDLVALHP